MTPLAVWARLQQPRRTGEHFHGCMTAVVARNNVSEDVRRAARQLLPAHMPSFDLCVTVADGSVCAEACAAVDVGARSHISDFAELQVALDDEITTPRTVIIDIGAVEQLRSFVRGLVEDSEPAWNVILALPLDTFASLQLLRDVQELLSELRRKSSQVAVVHAITVYRRNDDLRMHHAGLGPRQLPLGCDGVLHMVPAAHEMAWTDDDVRDECKNWTEGKPHPAWCVFGAEGFALKLQDDVKNVVNRCLETSGCTEVQLVKEGRGCGATGLLRSALVALAGEMLCCTLTKLELSPDGVEIQEGLIADFVDWADRHGHHRIVVGLDDDAHVVGLEAMPVVEASIQQENATAVAITQFRRAVAECRVRLCVLRVVPDVVATSGRIHTTAAWDHQMRPERVVISGYLIDSDVSPVVAFFSRLYPNSKEALKCSRPLHERRWTVAHVGIFGGTSACSRGLLCEGNTRG